MKSSHLLTLFILFSCCNEPPTEIFQTQRNETIDIQNKIKQWEINDPIISQHSNLYLMKNYIIITDWKAYDKQIHLFDKNNFQHITSTTKIGQGPKEITHINGIIPNERQGKFYAIDGGKRKLFSFDLDSLLTCSDYTFTTKADLLWDYPANFTYIEDTFTIAQMADFNEEGIGQLATGIWNINSGEFRKGYQHPIIEESIFQFAASKEAGIYITCYAYNDLITICDLNGNLKYNIYGPKWKDKSRNFKYFSMGACIGKDKIYTLYSGKRRNSSDNYPNKVFVFDINGNYLKTLETGYNTTGICYDEDNHRLIFSFDDDIQFGYLDLKGIIQ